MKKLFDYLFCRHLWLNHANVEYPENIYQHTEVLICSECGKIKIINY